MKGYKKNIKKCMGEYNSNTSVAGVVMILLLAIFANVLLIQRDGMIVKGEGENWWHSGWDYRKLISVNSGFVETTLTNFPILVHNSSDSDLSSHAQGDGDDICFILYSDNSTKLNHEIERYSSGALDAWVNISSLSSSTDTLIWMYYGNSTCGSQESVTDTWDSNFVAVYHGELNSSNDLIDSTAGANTLTHNATPTEVTATSKVGYSVDIDQGDWFSGGDDGDFNFSINDFTLEIWFSTIDEPGSYHDLIAKFAGSNVGYYLAFYRHDTIGCGPMFKAGGGTNQYALSPITNRAQFWSGTWHYMYGVKTSSDLDVYVNKTLDNNTAYNNENTNAAANFSICRGISNLCNGAIDEVRVSSNARNTSWMNTTYNTMHNTSEFVTFGSQENAPAGPNVAPTITGIKPVNGSTEAGLIPRLFAIINDANGDTLNATFRTNVTGSWVQFTSINNFTAGTNVSAMNLSMNNTNTEYWWSINVTDGTVWTNETYSFTSQTGNFSKKWKNIDFSVGMESFGKPVSEDINGDGIHEIFYTGRYSSSQTAIFCFNGSTGDLIWLVNMSFGINHYIPMAIDDLDNDGDYEIVHAAGTKTVARHANNGTIFWEVNEDSGWGVVAIADTDDSGLPYVFVSSNTGFEASAATRKLYGTNGTLAAINTNTTYTCYSGVSIADLDRDGEFEIVMSDAGDSICYDEDLNTLWTTAAYTSESHCAVLINVTGDADLEVILLDQSSSTDGLHIYHANGTIWKEDANLWNDNCCHTQPSAYDIDKDGHVEIIVGNAGTPAHVFDVVSWSNDTDVEQCSEPPDMANVLGDSDLEIVSGAAYVDGQFDIYDSSYANIDTINGEWSQCFIVQDVDGDGLNEIVWYGTGDNNFTCYDTLAVASTPGIRTDTWFYSERRTSAGIYIPKIGGKCLMANPSQANGTTGVSTSITSLTIDINEPTGDLVSWTIETSPDIGSALGISESNGTKSCTVAGLSAGITYTWYVNSTDGTNYNNTYLTFTTSNELGITYPYPTNASSAVWRSPTNLSAQVNGSGLSIYIYFQNMTPATDTWTLIESWTGAGSDRYEFTNLSTNFTMKEFLWGNATYNWSVNVTNGTAWTNASYSYTTNTTATGDAANAKYDTNNDNYVDVFDALNVWNSRFGQTIYNGIYDVSHSSAGNGEVTAQDVLYVWNNRG